MNGRRRNKYQGSPVVPFTISHQGTVTIRFRSDSSVQYSGFRAEVYGNFYENTFPLSLKKYMFV